MGMMQPGYGGPQFGETAKIAPPAHAGRRTRLNVVAICLSLFVPWLIFCFTMAAKGFWLHYMYPAYANLVVTLLLLVVLAFLALAVSSLKRRYVDSRMPFGEREEPSWYAYVFVVGLIGWILGFSLGNGIFWSYMQPYYDVISLNVYTSVDPVLMRGQQLMDAGMIEFVPDVSLVMDKARGFKNDKTYCVVPITSGSAAQNAPLAHYDFWAVGTNCCSDTSADFRCGDYNEAGVSQGLRVMADDARDFYRLAVQEASSAYGIDAIHPIFVDWTQNASDANEMMKSRGCREYILGMFGFFFGNLFLVYLAARSFGKL